MKRQSTIVRFGAPRLPLCVLLAFGLAGVVLADATGDEFLPMLGGGAYPFVSESPSPLTGVGGLSAATRLPPVEERGAYAVRPVDFVSAVTDYEEAADAGPGPDQFFTLDELREEMKKLAWTKGEYKIVPYGVLWGSAIYASQRVAPGAFIMYVQSPTVEGENDFVVDTRRTRVGLDVSGPRVPWFCGAETGGKLEVDFQGQYLNENQGTIQIRHAYAEVKNDYWRVMAGQFWDLTSPLLPSTVNYSVGWEGGNIGFRRMQIRVERYLHASDELMFSLQGAICQNIVPESLSRVTGVAPNQVYGQVIKPESSEWPILEGRFGCTLGDRGPGCQPVTFGVSGHIGQQGFDYRAGNPYGVMDDVRIQTWSANADVRVPVTDRMGVQGEFFTGQNLGVLLGGIGQGVNFATQSGIGSTGGWIEGWYDVTPRLHTHLGYGIDDPWNADLPAASSRSYNSFLFTNAFYDVTKKLVLGVEASYWTTRYLGQAEGNSLTLEFSGAYGF